MKIQNKTIELNTKEIFDFIDITDEIRNLIKESRIENGLVNVQVLHTTAAVVINENEPLLLGDFKKNLEATASQALSYQHDNFTIRTVNLRADEFINGHSHCKALHLSTSAVLNIIGGELQLGQWQRVFIAELDRPRCRKFQIQVLGE